MLFMPNISKFQYGDGFRVCPLCAIVKTPERWATKSCRLKRLLLVPNLQDLFEIRSNRIYRVG